jgi:hypothetical protein
MSRPAQSRPEPFRLLTDLLYAEWDEARIARKLRVTRSRVRGWKSGCKPRYDDYLDLLELHMEVMAEQCAKGEKPPG